MAYLVAFAVASITAWVMEPFYSPFWRGLGADVVATLIIYLFSAVFRNSSFYDPYWSLTPPVLMLYWCWDLLFSDLRILCLFIVTLLWSSRLTYNWMRSWEGLDHVDWRYENFKSTTGIFYPLVDFFGIHLAPTLMVFIGCLPFYWLANGDNASWFYLDYLWLTVGLAGLYLEMRADNVLRAFRLSNDEPGRVLDYDVWGVCRHPNYLGELSVWFAIGAASFAGLGTIESWVGFLVMLALFVFVSVPMIDKRLLGSKNDYQRYKDTTRSLIPIKRRG